MKEWSPILLNDTDISLRLISNVTIMETLPISNWATGGELLFTNSKTLPVTQEAMILMVEEMVQYSIPALIIKFQNTNNIQEAYADLLRYAEQKHLPIFAMPESKTYLSMISPIHDLLSETNRKNLIKEDLFRLLLANQKNHKSIIYSYANSIQVDLKGCKASMLAVEMHETNEPAFQIKIKNLFHLFFNLQIEQSSISEYLYLENEHVLYFLVLGSHQQIIKDTIVKALKQFIEEAHITICISKPANPLDTNLLFQQLDFTLQYGKAISNEQYLYYEDIELINMITHEDHEPLQSLYNDVILPLQEYTFLIDTMICYFKHHENIKQTAKELYIHVNTLQYRIHKTETLTGLKLQLLPDKLKMYLALSAYIIFQHKGGE